MDTLLQSATSACTAARQSNSVTNTDRLTSTEVETCGLVGDQHSQLHSTTLPAQPPSTIKQETDSAATTSETNTKLRFDNLVCYSRTESDMPNRTTGDAFDVIKTEREALHCENQEDEESADVERVMELMGQDGNATEPGVHLPEFPDRRTGTRLQGAGATGDLFRHTASSSEEVELDGSAVSAERGGEKVRAGKREVLRRVRRGLKTEDLMDLRVQFVTNVCGSVAASSTIPAKSKHKWKSSKSGVVKKQRSRTTLRRQNQPSVTTCKVDISREVVQQWRHIGSERGLATDTDIATFLVKHYQDVGERRCATCQSPLRLVCHKCPAPPPSPPNTPLSSTLSVSGPPQPPTSPPPPTSSPSPASSPGVLDDAEGDVAVESSSPQPDQVPRATARRRRRCGKGGRPHVCPECGSQFARSGGLKVHMRIHTGEKPYVCRECGQGFSQSGQLTVHMRKHKGERPYVCSVCPASFPLAGSLKQHMRVHTGDRPYPCSHCPRRFSYAGDLTVHMRKHTGDRPFLCSDCGKSFAVSSDLSKHKRIHSDLRPFTCSVCHKGFPFLNRLTLHMRTHTGDKPFLCADCGSSFSRASNLTVHRRVHHTFEKPFVCPYCQHAFADSANLSKHKKNKHGKHRTELQTPVPLSSAPDEYVPQAPASLACNSVADAEACHPGSDVMGPLGVAVAGAGQASGQLEANSEGEGDGGGQLLGGNLMGSGPVFPFYNYYYHQQHATHQY